MARPVEVHAVNYVLIRHMMRLRKKSLKDVAKVLDRSVTYVSDMVNGRSPINEERLKLISDFLGVGTPDYFRTSTGRLLLRKAENDLLDYALTNERLDARELADYMDLGERLGHIDFTPDLSVDSDGIVAWDFWKNPAILPFRSENAEEFWQFDGDEVMIRGPARCGKSTLIIEFVITTMLRNPGMQVLITRAYGVDLDAVRQNIIDTCKYKFDDPLSSIKVIGGKKFETVQINEGEITLKGIDRPGGLQGAGYEIVLHSQAEQIKKENIDYINSRCTPASNRWIVDGEPRSLVIYDLNPNRLDHWVESEIKKGVKLISFDFTDHPGYFTKDGEETPLFKTVHGRLSKLEGVVRQRLLEGKPANPEGTIFSLEPCHLLDELPHDFGRAFNFYRGFDFGSKDPNVCLWFAHHRHSGDLIVFREWRWTGTNAFALADAALKYTKDTERILDNIPDNNDDAIAMLRSKGIAPITPAKKGPDSVLPTIHLVQHRLEQTRKGEDGGLYFYNDVVGGRDPQLIADNAPLTVIDEGEVYSWAETADKPVDKHNHGWDIVRYMCDYLEHLQSAVGFGSGSAKRQTRL